MRLTVWGLGRLSKRTEQMVAISFGRKAGCSALSSIIALRILSGSVWCFSTFWLRSAGNRGAGSQVRDRKSRPGCSVSLPKLAHELVQELCETGQSLLRGLEHLPLAYRLREDPSRHVRDARDAEYLEAAVDRGYHFQNS